MVAKLKEISNLLKILRENGVHEFKSGEIHVILGERAFLTKPMIDTSKFEPNNNQKTDDDDLFYSGV